LNPRESATTTTFYQSGKRKAAVKAPRGAVKRFAGAWKGTCPESNPGLLTQKKIPLAKPQNHQRGVGGPSTRQTQGDQIMKNNRPEREGNFGFKRKRMKTIEGHGWLSDVRHKGKGDRGLTGREKKLQ